MNKQNIKEEVYFVKMLVVILAGMLIFTFTLIASYRNSQRQSRNLILPGGVTYLGPSSLVK